MKAQTNQEFFIETEHGILAKNFDDTPYPTFHNGLTYADCTSNVRLFSEKEAKKFIEKNNLKNAQIEIY